MEKQADRSKTHRIIAILWSKKYWITLAAVFFGLLGFAYAMTQTPQYQAEALVQLETRSSGVQLSADIAEMLAPESEAVTEIEILKSRLVLGKVVSALQLDVVAQPIQLPVIGNLLTRIEVPRPELSALEGYAWHSENITVENLSVPSAWVGETLLVTKQSEQEYTLAMPDGSVGTGTVGRTLTDAETGLSLNISLLTGRDDARFSIKQMTTLTAVNALRGNLTILEKTRGTGILSITMITDNAEKSEAIVGEIVDAYVNQNIGRSAEEAERSLTFLNEQLPVIQDQLRTAESALNEYRLESESIDLNFEAQSILERTVSLDSQLSGLTLEETELSRRYTSNHPTYRALLEKKQRLTEEKTTLAASVKTLPATQQEILRKTRDVDVSQQIYLQLLNKSQELSVMKAGAVGNVRLIDEAAAHPIPVAPQIPLLAALAALLGACAATGLILLKHNLSREIDSPDDLARLNIPIHAVVPFSSIQSRSSRKRDFALLSRENSNEMAVEAVRSLRTSLHFSLQDRERNIVSVTGPSPTIGKSFISVNLAFLAAQAGAKVLVIDGDMRRGNLGQYFNVPQDLPGLAQFLDGSRPPATVMYKIDLAKLQIMNSASNQKTRTSVQARARELVADIDIETASQRNNHEQTQQRQVTPHTGPSITVVPRGQAPANPAELLMGNRLPEFLERASQDFDLVVVDTPPVLAATDAMIIGKYSDINLMVVRQGETTTHEAEEVVRTFSNNKSRIAGIVLNGYDAQRGKYGTQYGYRYSYD